MQWYHPGLSGLLLVVLLNGCALFSSEEDVVVMSPLPEVENQFIPTEVWRSPVGDGVDGFYSRLRPTWQGNRVFAADRKGLIKAMDADSGKKIWQITLAEKRGLLFRNKTALLAGGLTVSGTQLYVGSEKAQIYALHTDDGHVVWQTQVAGEVLSRPVVSNGLVLVHTTNGMLQALNESDGAIQWSLSLDTVPLSLRGESTPAVTFGAAIVGGDNGRVSAVLMETGQFIWQQRISQVTGATEIDRLNDVDITPVVVNEVVYALSYNGHMAALDLRTGQILWQRPFSSVHDFIVDAGHIYLVDSNDRIVALNVNGGTTLWNQTELSHRNLTAPVMYNGFLVVGDGQGYLHWLNTRDGRFAVQQEVDNTGFLSAPIVVDGRLLIQARNGKVYAFTR